LDTDIFTEARGKRSGKITRNIEREDGRLARALALGLCCG
jgi:hypothetical protein